MAEIWVEGSGGYRGCSDSIYVSDFILHVNQKAYRFVVRKDGSLVIHTINGVTGDIDIDSCYRAIFLDSHSSEINDYQKKDKRKMYLSDIQQAKACTHCISPSDTESGDDYFCKANCPFAKTGPNMLYSYCECTEQPLSALCLTSKQTECPFK